MGKFFVTRRSVLKNRPLRSSMLPSGLTTNPVRCEFTGASAQPFGLSALIAAALPRTANTAAGSTPAHRRSEMLIKPSPLLSKPVVGV